MTLSPYVPTARLRPGDAVAVVAPSSPIRLDLLEQGLAEVRRLGFEPVTRADISSRHRFTAGDDRRRRDELAWALSDAAVRAVWMARGGHGLTPLLRSLDPAPLVSDPKPVVGESDATALGCWALTAGVSWLHGPMVAAALRLGAGKGYDEASLLAALTGEGGPRRDRPPGVRTLVPGEVEGVAWGGCLSILCALGGTPWLPRVRQGLLFLEDTGVKPYQVHRMLVQLRDAGVLAGAVGVALGDFSDCVQHADQGYDMDEVFADFFRDALPGAVVTAGWPIGHAAAPHLAVPMGASARLVARPGEPPEISWDGPASG